MALSSNAKMAINFEHAWGDGVAVVRFLNEVCETSASDTYQPKENSSGALSVRRLDFDIDSTTKENISKGNVSLTLNLTFNSSGALGL